DHGRRHHRQGQHPGHEEVEGVPEAGVDEVDVAEEDEDPDGDAERDDEALAPPQRELRLDLDLGTHAPQAHRSSPPAVDGSDVTWRNTSSRVRLPARRSPRATP